MPTSCSAFGCTNTLIKPDCIRRNVSFHKFPHHDVMQMKVWLLKMRRKNFCPTRSSKLCSDHFDRKCFIRNKQRKLLKKGAVPTIFSFSDPPLIKPTPSTVRFMMRYKENDTSKPDDVFPKISSVNHIEQLHYDEMNPLSGGDHEDIPAVACQTILTEDPINTVDISPERSIDDKLILPIRVVKNFSVCQRLRAEAERLSALEEERASNVVKRSMKRAWLELEIKAANAKRDYYEKKRSSLSFRRDASNLKNCPLSLTGRRVLKGMKDEESAFNTEKKVLRQLLDDAKRKAATSIKNYHELKTIANPSNSL